MIAASLFGYVAQSKAGLLLGDTFDSTGSFSSPTQTGTLAPVTYTTTLDQGQIWTAQYGNSAALLLTSSGGGHGATASLNYNFASNPNVQNGVLIVTLDARWSSAAPSSSDWLGIAIGNAMNAQPNSTGVGYGLVLAQDGTTQEFQKGGGSPIGFTGANTWSANTANYQTITIELSDGHGGSAFNGNGSVADLYSGSTLISELTLSQLNSSQGYITFADGPWNSGYSVALFDNLQISAVPEPVTTALELFGGTWGLVAILLRHRKTIATFLLCDWNAFLDHEHACSK